MIDVSLKPRRAVCDGCALGADCWTVQLGPVIGRATKLCDTCCTRLALFLGQREQ